MSLQRIKNGIHQGVDELFETAAVDELAGDAEVYHEKLTTIAKIADLLDIETKLTTTTLELKESESK